MANIMCFLGQKLTSYVIQIFQNIIYLVNFNFASFFLVLSFLGGGGMALLTTSSYFIVALLIWDA